MDRLRHAIGTLSSARAMQRLRLALIAGAVATGALDTWFYRQWNLNPDGVSYFDLARAFVAHGPEALVNGYWSPLYPAFIGTALGVFSPGPDWIYPMVRVLGFAVYLLTIVAFDRLVRVSILSRLPGHETDRWLAPVILVTAWGLFFLLVSQAIGLFLATPDMGVAAIVLFVATELFELSTAPWRTSRWIRLGVVLGIGYWWKAILFPVGAVTLVVASVVAWRRRDPARGMLSGGVAFALLSLALAVPISRQVGRVTFGETGRLNQIWYVNNGPRVSTLCISPVGRLDQSRSGLIPKATMLLERPLTCGMPDRWPEATLPIWYDPSPWYAEASARVDVRETLVAFRNDVRFLRDALAEIAPLASIALVALLAIAVAARAPIGNGSAAVVMSVVAIGAYLVVYVELRHVVPFLLCIALAAFGAIAAQPSRWARIGLLVLAAATIVDGGIRLARQQRVEFAIAVHAMAGRPMGEQVSVVVARELQRRGLSRGDRVAAINTLWNVEWAQRVGLVVRAYVPDLTYPIPRAFTELGDACIRDDFVDSMKRERIQAVVVKGAPGFATPDWFDPLGDTGWGVHVLGDGPLRGVDCTASSSPQSRGRS